MPRGPDSIGESFDQVLAAAQANAPWAFNRLYQAFAGKVAGYLRVQGASEPDDLTSEVFLGAFSTIRSFTGSEPQFRSWLFTIAHRRLTDERRRRYRQPPLSGSPPAESQAHAADAEGEALRRVGEERVRELCGRLVPDQRDVLLLRLLADFTVEQVAEALGKSQGAVKALQRRGIAALRKELEREGVTL